MTDDRVDILAVLEAFGARFGRIYSWDEEVPVFCPACEDRDSRNPAGRANILKNVYFCHACGVGGNPRTLLDQWTTIEILDA